MFIQIQSVRRSIILEISWNLSRFHFVRFCLFVCFLKMCADISFLFVLRETCIWKFSFWKPKCMWWQFTCPFLQGVGKAITMNAKAAFWSHSNPFWIFIRDEKDKLISQVLAVLEYREVFMCMSHVTETTFRRP